MNRYVFRPAQRSDAEALWEIIEPTLKGGDTWVFAPPQSAQDKIKFLDFWLHSDKFAYICACEGQVVGTFFIKANQPDLGNHIANAGYMTHPALRGKGVGYAMGKASLKIARQLGFDAMQFNIVVKTNESAVRLWQRLGFEIIATLPKVFRHATYGKTDAYIMFRALDDQIL